MSEALQAIVPFVSMGELLQPDGAMPPHRAADLDRLPWESLRIWCHMHARYHLPTVELVEWLRERIGGRKAIEIGAGHGDLARALGCPATDSKIQDQEDVRAYYRLTGQPTIAYPDFVEKLEAGAAIRAHDPDVVVAAWVTEWISPRRTPPPQGGSIYGVHERAIVASGRTYVLIGAEKVHGRKRIMALPHERHELPFVRSRSREGNCVWIWNPEGRRHAAA